MSRSQGIKDNKHLREKPIGFSLNCLMSSFLYLLIVKNNQAAVCKEQMQMQGMWLDGLDGVDADSVRGCPVVQYPCVHRVKGVKRVKPSEECTYQGSK